MFLNQGVLRAKCCRYLLGNKQNQNLPDETRKFPKLKFGSIFVPAHFEASWFRFYVYALYFAFWQEMGNFNLSLKKKGGALEDFCQAQPKPASQSPAWG